MTSGTIEKSLAYEFLPFLRFSGRVVPAMLFADGENLAIRYKELSQKRGIEVQQTSSVAYEPDVLLWSDILNELCDYAGVVRKHYYTSVVGSEETRRDVEDRLKNSGIESPYVFKKPKHGKNRRSKAVDISLAVDMLTNAHRKNYALAILIAGDGDYVPLVKAVKAEGSRVFVWFFDESHGLSRDLRISADYYAEISLMFPF